MAVDAQAWSKFFVVVVGFELSPINHFPHSPLGQPLVVSLLVCFCFLCVFFNVIIFFATSATLVTRREMEPKLVPQLSPGS